MDLEWWQIALIVVGGLGVLVFLMWWMMASPRKAVPKPKPPTDEEVASLLLARRLGAEERAQEGKFAAEERKRLRKVKRREDAELERALNWSMQEQ